MPQDELEDIKEVARNANGNPTFYRMFCSLFFFFKHDRECVLRLTNHTFAKIMHRHEVLKHLYSIVAWLMKLLVSLSVCTLGDTKCLLRISSQVSDENDCGYGLTVHLNFSF